MADAEVPAAAETEVAGAALGSNVEAGIAADDPRMVPDDSENRCIVVPFAIGDASNSSASIASRVVQVASDGRA